MLRLLFAIATSSDDKGGLQREALFVIDVPGSLIFFTSTHRMNKVNVLLGP